MFLPDLSQIITDPDFQEVLLHEPETKQIHGRQQFDDHSLPQHTSSGE